MREYQSYFRDAPNIRAWASAFLPSSVVDLDGASFAESVLEDTAPWLVVFSAPAWCGPCQMFAPEFQVRTSCLRCAMWDVGDKEGSGGQLVARKLAGRVKAGFVDCDQSQATCQLANVQAYPTLRFYDGAASSYETQALCPLLPPCSCLS